MISFAASSTLWPGASDVYAVCTLIGFLSVVISATFSGKSMKVAPGFSVCATLNALRTISGTMPGSRICVEYLVIGWNMLTRSRIWWLSLCSRVVAPWPAMATIGARSMLASATPVMRFVAPGTQRGHAHARAAGQAAVDVGHEGRALLVVRGDELDRAVEQRIHDVDVLFAGDAEDVLDTFVLQALDEQFSGFHSGSSRVFAAVVSRS